MSAEQIAAEARKNPPSHYTLSSEHHSLMHNDLETIDPEIFELAKKEIKRQQQSIVLIASENITSSAVLQALGTPMSNKYSEGYPGNRYYGGNEHIDAIEITCQNRALAAFRLDPAKWGVNVQCLSGSPANLQVYQALMRPGERLMGLDLPHGGHLSHGYQRNGKKVSAVSAYFETFPYRLNLDTELIDYDKMAEDVLTYYPKILVAGTSAYCREIDYKRMREIADSVGAYLVMDMAHISGLVAAGVMDDPFEYADVVTTTTHKSLRGPRGAMIFFRRGVRSEDPKKGTKVMYDLEGPINSSVFPGHQGGPHNHTITALAVALKQAASPEFKKYQEQVKKNITALSKELLAEDKYTVDGKEVTEPGYDLVSNGTDNHMVLIKLITKGPGGKPLRGDRLTAVLDEVNIACNKNTIPEDKNAMAPSGIRIGAPAMTSRGMGEEDFVKIAKYIKRAVRIVNRIQTDLPKEANLLKHFKAKVAEGSDSEINALREEVTQWANTFPLPI